MGYGKITLKDGLRILTVQDGNTKAVTVLVVVGTGSKYETKETNGISHFLEHMFFKGTKKRPTALKLAETLDRVGGVYNAFTSKEYTGYFAKVRSEYFDLALDWVSDIFLLSKIESSQINKEKGVILEEFNMYLDTPVKYIGELWESLLYGDQPAGWDTIGTKENILKFQQRHFLNYFQSHYCASNTIVCLSGRFNKKEALEKVKRHFQIINIKAPAGKPKTKEKQGAPEILLHFKQTDQTHLCLGVRGYDLFNEQKYALDILAVILGGNMSSRLFTEIREKRGLAYYLHTDSENYTDSGYLVTQAGVPHKELAKVVGLILKEYKNIRQKKISPTELKKAKDYLKGTLTLSLESSDAKASFYAGQELLAGKILTLEEECAKIGKVTVKDLAEAAFGVFSSEKLNLAVIGPHKSTKNLKDILKI